jgi:hypothetical protein
MESWPDLIFRITSLSCHDRVAEHDAHTAKQVEICARLRTELSAPTREERRQRAHTAWLAADQGSLRERELSIYNASLY